MAEQFSTGLRNLMLGGRSLREVFDDFVITIHSGSAPANADAAETGTLLCKITKNSQEVTSDERSIAKQSLIQITSATTGQTIIVAINGVDYTYTVLSEDTNLRAVARKVALMLSDIPEIEAIAVASGTSDGNIAVKSRIAGLSYTIAKGGGGGGGTATWSITDNTISNSRSDALQFDAPASGVVQKPAGETWSGVNVASGTASWFRIKRPNDTGGNSTTFPRIQGAVGTSGAELNLSSINLVQNATTTITSGSLNLPAS